MTQISNCDQSKADKILLFAENHVGSRNGFTTSKKEHENVKIIVAVADPKIIEIGPSIQSNYLLTDIKREYGVPFARDKNSVQDIISDPIELHSAKWGLEVHEAVFKGDLVARFRVEKMTRDDVIFEMTTGQGNVLQNLHIIAYIRGKLLHVEGEKRSSGEYPCLVRTTEMNSDNKLQDKVSIEILKFPEGGTWNFISKESYFSGNKSPNVRPPKETVRWAISGYPLILNSKKVDLERIAGTVSDFRHLWSLPMLEKSLCDPLKELWKNKHFGKEIKDAPQIEFYFGLNFLTENDHIINATSEKNLTIPIKHSVTSAWLRQMCEACDLQLEHVVNSTLYDKDSSSLQIDARKMAEDFISAGYEEKKNMEDVTKKGDFFINESGSSITVNFLDAYYPHHIVGIDKNDNVVNISICGLSGRTGITIKKAQELCEKIDLKDALIFDNGNDVFAKIRGQHVIAHEENPRLRLTVALHFASRVSKSLKGGFEVRANEKTVVISRSEDAQA